MRETFEKKEVASQWMPSPANSGITCPLSAKRINKLSREGGGAVGCLPRCSDRVPLSFLFSHSFPPQIMNFDIESTQALRNFPQVRLSSRFPLIESILRKYTPRYSRHWRLNSCWSSTGRSHTGDYKNRVASPIRSLLVAIDLSSPMSREEVIL